MPYDDPDPTDPMTLTGVELYVDQPGAIEEMAECFIEEYVRIGLSPDAISQLFESREYAGPTLALDQLGRDRIQEMIHQHMLIRGPRALRLPVDRIPGGTLNLPVM